MHTVYSYSIVVNTFISVIIHVCIFVCVISFFYFLDFPPRIHYLHLPGRFGGHGTQLPTNTRSLLISVSNDLSSKSCCLLYTYMHAYICPYIQIHSFMHACMCTNLKSFINMSSIHTVPAFIFKLFIYKYFKNEEKRRLDGIKERVIRRQTIMMR